MLGGLACVLREFCGHSKAALTNASRSRCGRTSSSASDVVDADSFTPGPPRSSSHTVTLMAVGRSRNKNDWPILSILSRARECRTGCQRILVGSTAQSGPYRASLERQARALGSQSRRSSFAVRRPTCGGVPGGRYIRTEFRLGGNTHVVLEAMACGLLSSRRVLEEC